jgi:hypothetical protein
MKHQRAYKRLLNEYGGKNGDDGNDHQQLNQAKGPAISGLLHRCQSNVARLGDNVRLGAHPAEMSVVSCQWSVVFARDRLGRSSAKLSYSALI